MLAARVAVGVDLVPWRLNHPGSGFGLADSFSTLGTRFGNGFSDFYGTHLPFDPRVHVAMHELVLSGLFLFALGVALLAAARKPVASALMLLVGAGWPATLLGPSRGVAMGAAILGGALVLLGGLGSRRVPALAIPAAVVVAVAAIAVGSATAARHGLVHWQSWNLAHVATGPSDVGFVWNAQYGGLKFSGHPTNVLQVQSDQPPTYLRATVLDDFRQRRVGDRAAPSGRLARARGRHRPRNQTREVVTVNALADTHLVGGSIPMRFEAADGAPLVRLGPGFAALNQNLPQGFRYTVWSYARRPDPGRLAPLAAGVPDGARRRGLLDVGDGVAVPPFGAPNRADRGRSRSWLRSPTSIGTCRSRAWRSSWPAAPGLRTTRSTKLEQWFVSSGTFHYSNHPPVVAPPLVGFVTKTHAGYCQYFAGAMALMLRYLGIPARVAVGFAGRDLRPERSTSGTSATARRMPGSRSGSRATAGCRSTRRRPLPGAAPRQTQAGVRRPAGTEPRIDRRPRPMERRRPPRGASAFEQKLRTEQRVRPQSAADTTAHGRRRRASAAAAAVPIAAGRSCFCSPPSPRRSEGSCWPRSAFA